jgi:hypothetical protein
MAKSKLAFLALAFAAVLLVASSGTYARSLAPPPGLTVHGRLVWQFEALLRDTFGRASVCEGPRYTVNFVTRPCVPLSDYNAYEFIFLNARHSSLKRTRTPPSGLGNVVPVRVGGQYVRCGNSRWLVMLGSGIFALSCVHP